MGRKVLVVEDSPTMRQLVAFALKRLGGIDLVEASDGVDALKKLSATPCDLIITDINMPIMDGLKLISLVKQNPAMKEIPIIIITTEGAEEDRRRGLALGANAYIAKPIQTHALMQLVRDLLAGT